MIQIRGEVAFTGNHLCKDVTVRIWKLWDILEFVELNHLTAYHL